MAKYEKINIGERVFKNEKKICSNTNVDLFIVEFVTELCIW